jgi:hypothetical protein
MKTQTTDATPKKLGTIQIGATKAGLVTVSVVGFDNTDAVTGIKAARYKKVAGTLTLGTPGAVLAVETDTGLGSATFTLSAVANNIDVMVTGAAGKTINWVGIVNGVS